MKTILVFTCLIIIASCATSENKSTSDADSTANADTVNTIAEIEDDTSEEVTGEDSLTLDQRFTELKEFIDSNTDSLLEVSISTHQYEAGSTITWYFDAEVKPVYFSISWSSEGNEGSTEYLIKEGEVLCAWVENNSTEEKWCKSTGGVRTTTDENSGDATKEELEEGFGAEQSASLQTELDKLSDFFREAGDVEEDGDWITFRLENVVNYGAEFTEYTEARVHRRVFEAMK